MFRKIPSWMSRSSRDSPGVLLQYIITSEPTQNTGQGDTATAGGLVGIAQGAGAAEIAARVEAAIAAGALVPEARLPTVRELAATLAVSPATVAAAYRTLK